MEKVYCYVFKVNEIAVYFGISSNVENVAVGHQASGKFTIKNEQRLDWKDGIVEVVKGPVGINEALDWKRDKEESSRQDFLNSERNQGYFFSAFYKSLT